MDDAELLIAALTRTRGMLPVPSPGQARTWYFSKVADVPDGYLTRAREIVATWPDDASLSLTRQWVRAACVEFLVQKRFQ